MSDKKERPATESEAPKPQANMNDVVDLVHTLLDRIADLEKRIPLPQTTNDGRGILVADGTRVQVKAGRVPLLRPFDPSEPGNKTRWTSQAKLSQRLAEGWRIHPSVPNVAEMVAIETSPDNQILAAKRSQQEALSDIYEHKTREAAARGPQPVGGGVSTFVDFHSKVGGEFPRSE
jgi:hypothetical protein